MSDWSRRLLRDSDPPGGGGADSAAEAALRAAREAIASLANDANAAAAGVPPTPVESDEEPAPAPISAGTPLELPKFQPSGTTLPPKAIDLLANVALKVRIELGRTRMLVEDVLRLGDGSVIELDKLAGDPVDIYVNDRPVAKGEVLVLNDNFCVRINEIIDPASLEGGVKASA
ncbi:MAG: flagellar motor switch protein FliN [Phycisphaerales bacterium]|jgi:flagellar motor switch protein FliN/FliY|nr:flagellar motor switch protein FliN [Phycisphaerales bacterium]